MPSVELPGYQFRIERLTADPRQEASKTGELREEADETHHRAGLL